MKVEKLDHYGRGIIKENGKIGFIKNALINEEIEYKIISEHKNYFEGEMLKVNNKNDNRIEPICKYYLECGGCNLLHMNSELKRSFKEEKVENVLRNLNIKINNLVYSNEFNYRNKVVLHVSNGKLGFYKDKSNFLIEIDKCYLLNNKINEVISYLKDYVKKETNINKITIKLGNITNEVMIIIDGIVNSYSKLLDICDCLIINDKIITDKENIISYIGNKKYYISRNSFFQVNYDISTKIYDKVKDYIKEMNSKNVLDLYCGVGTIGIYVADIVDNVLGIEVVDDAIEDAIKTKELNGINNIEFMLGKAEDLIKDLNNKFDTVIVDPPRSGLDKKVVNFLKTIKPNNIIYVSCDIMTLKRDLEFLKEDYKVLEVTPYDMFPNTYHVETVMILERKTL